MKRILALVLAALMALALVGCAAEPATPAETPDNTVTEPAQNTTPETPAEEPAEAPSEEPADEPVETPVEEPAEDTTIPLPLAENLTFSFWTLINEGFMPYTTLAEHPAYAELAKRTNVTPEYVHPPESGAQDQYGLILASGDYYDVMNNQYAAYTDIEMVENEIAIDLSELIPQYMPNYYGLVSADENLRRDVLSEDGRMLNIRSLNEQSALNWWGLGIRKDLLANAGLELPVTYDDWAVCLQALKDAGVEIPLFMPRAGYFYNNGFEAGLGTSMTFFQDGAEVKYGPMEDEFLDFLTLMNDWYNKGYISSTFVSDEERFYGIPTIADVAGGVVGSCIITSSEIGTMYAGMSGNPDFYFAGVANPVKADGSSKVWSTVGGSGLVGGTYIVTADMDESKLPQLLTYFDYLYAGAGADLVSWGVEGDAYYVDENGEKFYTDKINTTEYDNVNTFHVYGLTMLNTPGLYNDKERVCPPNQKEEFEETLAMKSLWAAAGTGFGTLPGLSFTAEESEDYSGKQTDCDTHVAENVAKFVMGIRPLSEFDDFRNELRSLGIEEATEIYQTAFDRYYNR